jgi:predicted deacylase
MHPALLITCLLAAGCVGAHRMAASPAEVETETSASRQTIWTERGVSVQGRSIRSTTFGHGPRRVLWIGGIHGDEREGALATASLIDAAASVRNAEDRITLLLVEDINPDGTAMRVRGNANGVDLNRNFPAPNFRQERQFGMEPLSQPESRLLHDLILEFKPHLVMVMHSWRGSHFINFDGPARHLAERLAALSGYELRASSDIAPTPGSLGSWVGNTLRLPILTLEYERGRDPRTAWEETRAGILAAIFEN